MIDRIIESFTKPKMEITAIDEFIQCMTIVGLMVLVYFIYIIISYFIEKR